MLRRTILIAAVLGVAACGSGQTGQATSGASGTSGSGGVTVTAQNLAFTPATLSVTPGQTVTWKNADTVDHTVTSGANGQPDGKFDHLLHPGDTFQFTFMQAGTYPYFCRYHVGMGMTGTVSVGSGSTANTGGTTASSGGTTASSGGTSSGTGGY